MFKLESSYKPTGDQPQAIQSILQGFSDGKNKITLLGATGTGKTFTMANIIKKLKKPTLVISHNKTLAAQLATEFKYFFPNNAVHYFVSYFDYYQPEAYLPEKDIYIEKESTINQEIEMFRLSTMASLLTREDVIVVSSVSALYGLGAKENFQRNMLNFEVGKRYDFQDIKRKLILMQYKLVQSKIEPGMFDIKGELLDIYSSVDKILYRLIFNEDELEVIQTKDALSYEDLGLVNKVVIWPASQFLQDMSSLEEIIKMIQQELDFRIKELEKQGKQFEARRLEKRVSYDIRMMKETGFVNGIENYSLYFDKRLPGQPPNTLFDYFPDDFLVIVDESHMSLPQLRAMPQGDMSRKQSLIDHGFRLPSAADHRPLNFKELEVIMKWKSSQDMTQSEDEMDNIIKETFVDNLDTSLFEDKIKKAPKTLFVSATPAQYELGISDKIVQQIIRPTGLLDPLTYVYPKSGDYELLSKSLERLLKQKPSLEKYLQGYDKNIDLKDIFFGE